jgi:hypothetical protein
VKKRPLVRDEWRVLSDKFVRHYRLPYGTKLVLEHSYSTSTGRRRRARNDQTFTRRLFRGSVSDDNTVKELIDDHLLPALLVDPSTRKLCIKLVGPNGEEVKSKKMQIGTVRGWTPLPTPGEIEAEEQLNAEIDEIAKMADLDLRSEEEIRDDSERVLRGYVRALIQRYGLPDVRKAVEQGQ